MYAHDSCASALLAQEQMKWEHCLVCPYEWLVPLAGSHGRAGAMACEMQIVEKGAKSRSLQSTLVQLLVLDILPRAFSCNCDCNVVPTSHCMK
jgi:hypothetical protein